VTHERADQLQRPDLDVHEPDNKVGKTGEPGIASAGASRFVEELFEGRDAYFSDPEGNFWEIAYAPPDNPVVAAFRRAAGFD
jgi:hypothetical protein